MGKNKDIKEQILESLQDEESKKLFLDRVDFMDKKIDDFELLERILNYLEVNLEIQTENLPKDKKELIIFALGEDGKTLTFVLQRLGYKIVAFGDNNPSIQNSFYKGIEILSAQELKQKYKNKYPIVISNLIRKEDIKENLIKIGLKDDNIYSLNNIKIEVVGQQYFSINEFKVNKNEVFIDAGALDGSSSVGFSSWCKGEYKKIFMFEPNINQIAICRQTISDNNLKNCELVNAGLGQKEEILSFSASQNLPGASKIVESGELKIKVLPLDEVVGEEKVTFIKMDIEGFELKALKGAKKIIERDKPKLAICIYHKEEDVIEIPEYILSLVPEYKLWIRHHLNYLWETVLYASI